MNQNSFQELEKQILVACFRIQHSLLGSVLKAKSNVFGTTNMFESDVFRLTLNYQLRGDFNLLIFACFNLNTTIQSDIQQFVGGFLYGDRIRTIFLEFSDKFCFVCVSDDFRKISIKIEFGQRVYIRACLSNSQ